MKPADSFLRLLLALVVMLGLVAAFAVGYNLGRDDGADGPACEARVEAHEKACGEWQGDLLDCRAELRKLRRDRL